MFKEKKIIKEISRILPRSKKQQNRLFESDAEIITQNNKNMLYSIDEFSDEDHFRMSSPYTLGWNMATAAISDILACGGQAHLYGHNLVVDPRWKTAYIKQIMKGVAAVLKKNKTAFIGGDFGISYHWRYCVTVIGESSGEPLKRSGAACGDLIYLSGKAGAGNLEALLKLASVKKLIHLITKNYKIKFPLKIKKAALIKNYATACIDTSDGINNALNEIADNSKCGFSITGFPYHSIAARVASLAGLPKMMLFLGEAGEYELLFTMKPHREKAFLTEAKSKRLAFYKLGEITDKKIKSYKLNANEVDLSKLSIRARNYTNSKEYLEKLTEWCKEQFYG